MPVKCIWAPWWLGLLSILGGGSVVVDFLFIVTPIVRVCNCSLFCCTLLYFHSSIAIILMGKRELIALLNLSSWCLMMVERLFLAVPLGCLQFVIVVFPDHTHLLLLHVQLLTGVQYLLKTFLYLKFMHTSSECSDETWHLQKYQSFLSSFIYLCT